MFHIDLQGARIPRLGFGTWQLTGADCLQSVGQALDIGYRHIDTAQAYDNEEEVGEAIAKSPVPRHEVFLTTKVWRDNVSAERLEASVQASLKRLKTDYVDLLLIHWPVAEVPLEETLQALDGVRKAGMTRLIGVSNFTVPLLQRAAAILPGALVCNQVEYHPFLSQGPVRALLHHAGMFLTAYSPLARGQVSKEPVLIRIAQTHGKTPAQIVLRWMLQQDRVAAIPKASNPAHIQSNIDIFDFSLSEQEMQEISGLARSDGRMINPSWAPQWDAALSGQAA